MILYKIDISLFTNMFTIATRADRVNTLHSQKNPTLFICATYKYVFVFFLSILGNPRKGCLNPAKGPFRRLRATLIILGLALYIQIQIYRPP